MGWEEAGRRVTAISVTPAAALLRCPFGVRQKREPGVHAAIRFGAVLENVCFDEDSREVDWGAARITENTRAAYPIENMGGL